MILKIQLVLELLQSKNNSINGDIMGYIFNIFNCILRLTSNLNDKYNAKIHIHIYSNYLPIHFNINNDDKNDLFIRGYNHTTNKINILKKQHTFNILRKNIISRKYYIKYWYNLFLKLI